MAVINGRSRLPMARLCTGNHHRCRLPMKGEVFALISIEISFETSSATLNCNL
jgi:hypothetical protein